MSTTQPLTPAQTHALFDILIHHQVYAEIEAFKYPSTIDHYGYPFRKVDGVQSTSPLLQNMLNKFALCNPAIRNFGESWWSDKIQTLVARMAEAELSESYDKGAIGSRKALATAASSIAEYVARGMLGGYPAAKKKESKKEYDTSKPEDVIQGFEELVKDAIYGNALDDLYEKVKATPRLEDHSSSLQAAHEYMLLNAASFLHHVFVMSPDGQYLVRLVENLHRLIPYTVIRQTLRVGNAATMINGMVRLVLAKLSVTAMTNWIGLTNNTNDGMNLLQQIISTILAWDTTEFQKRATKLESSRNAPDKKVFKAIKTYVYASRDKHEAARSQSVSEQKSIAAVILETSDPPYKVDADTLNEHQHSVAMEYLSTYLSIRDREELTKVLCKSNPDVLTSTIRDAVAAMDPVIRDIHNAVDLSGTVTDAEAFITDLIKTAKPKKKTTGTKSRETSKSRPSSPSADPASILDEGASDAPTVEDFVTLLKKHAPSMHKFLHHVTKNAPQLAQDYLVYAKRIFSEFRVDEAAAKQEEKGEGGAGNMTAPLHSLFETLGKEKQEELKGLLDQHEEHLQTLKSTSQTRLESIMRPSSSSSSSSQSKPSAGTTHGPGMYLSRWNALLDSTLISPATIHGPVRKGWEVKGELDGKGLKTNSTLVLDNKDRKRDRVSAMMADGTGDKMERKERRRDGLEEENYGATRVK
ncbi:PX-associated-domain-containing protein [Alternaria alternata]|nr:PX-associated-domain-containing protein [Alternaria alternata]